jgi:hypothetical protein
MKFVDFLKLEDKMPGSEYGMKVLIVKFAKLFRVFAARRSAPTLGRKKMRENHGMCGLDKAFRVDETPGSSPFGARLPLWGLIVPGRRLG